MSEHPVFIAAINIGGPCLQAEWVVLFLTAQAFALAFAVDWFQRKQDRLQRIADRIDAQSDQLWLDMRDGRCTVCSERHESLRRPFDYVKDGDFA